MDTIKFQWCSLLHFIVPVRRSLQISNGHADISLGNFLRCSKITTTPMKSNSGETLPYGLGWFIHWENDVKIIWHYGYWTAISSLIIKVPEKDLNFFLLANNDMLSRASYGIGSDSDVTRSVPAEEFLNGFVFGNAELPTEPYSP